MVVRGQRVRRYIPTLVKDRTVPRLMRLSGLRRAWHGQHDLRLDGSRFRRRCSSGRESPVQGVLRCVSPAPHSVTKTVLWSRRRLGVRIVVVSSATPPRATNTLVGSSALIAVAHQGEDQRPSDTTESLQRHY